MLTRTFASFVTVLTLSLGAPSLAQDTAPSVTEIVTARGYDRTSGAVDPTTSFAHDSGNVVVVIRLNNPSGTEQDVHVAFERAEGEPSARPEPPGMALHIPAARRYRTVARGTTNRPPGAYRAVVRSDAGDVIGSVDFTVTE